MSRAFLAAVERTIPAALEQAGGRAVLLPRSVQELATAITLAQQTEARLAPPGSEAREGAIPIDLRHLSEVVSFDDTSQIVNVQAGMTLAALDSELRKRGLTLGAWIFEPEQTVGAWLAVGAPGARSPDDDPVSQLVAGLDLVLPDGRELSVRPAPRRAVGPDLVRAAIGARGRLGVVVAVCFCARRRVATREKSYLFPTRDDAAACRAWLRGRGVRPAWTEVAEVPEGSALTVSIDAEGPLAAAALTVLERTVEERRGVAVRAGDGPKRRRPAVRAPSAVVVELASRLDAGGVFG